MPVNGVVREGDGTMTVWVTTDRRHFTKRVVKIGLQHDGYDQISTGCKPGELVVTDGAVFLDNMLATAASPTDAGLPITAALRERSRAQVHSSRSA